MIASVAAGEINNTARLAESKIRGTALGEILILNSVRELAPSDESLKSAIDNLALGIRKTADEQVKMMVELASARNRQNGLPAYVLKQSDAEKIAAKRKPVMKVVTRDTGYRAYQSISSKIPAAEMSKINIRSIASPEEALKLANGSNSILDIKYILDAQYSRETSLESLNAFFNALESIRVTGF
jgi:hypothetical protein